MKHRGILFILLILVLVVLFIADLCIGSVNISLHELLQDSRITHQIIYNFRLPKALTAIEVGFAIALAGLIMQTLFHNPLAGPYVLGISSGASLGVALFTLSGSAIPSAFATSGWGLTIAAVLGSVLVLLLVLSVSFRVKQAVSLLIIGIMFGQVAGSLVTILQNSADPDSLKLFIVWTFGSLSAVSWHYMWVMLPLIIVGLMIVLFLTKPLNALLLGENYAHSLGISIIRTRFWIIIAVALLAGTTTAFTGPIAFIGIAVPHIARGLFKTSNHQITIPASGLIGAILLLACDLATLLPANGSTLPINAISALVGAPIIIWIILKNKS